VHVNTDRPGYLKLIKEGLYLNWTVPNLEQRFPKATYEPGYAVAPYSTRMVLSYNPDRLSTTDAEKLLGGTWTGLLDARFKGGRIGYVHPTSASQAVLWYWALSEDANYGPAFLTKVAAQNPVILNGSAAAREALAAGEVDLLIGDVEEPNMEGFEKGEKIRWLYPDLLPAYATVTHFISASAPHKNAAQLLVAWLLSDDGAVAISHAGRVPTHTSVTEDKRPQIEGLRKTDWWKPFPAKAMFSPSYAEQDAKYSDYERRSLATFNIR
jgi:iron(III) transport system substrate-binding protein